MSDEQKPDPPGKRGRKTKLPPGAQAQDFYSILSQDKYMFVPTRRLWNRDAVVHALGSDTVQMIDSKRACHELTWAPGLPMIVQNRVILNGAWREHPGANTFNAYCPPDPIKGDPAKVKPWLDLGQFIFGDQVNHLIAWLAHRVQRPHVKINHCIVLGSLAHGIGKDTWLLGAQRGVGAWNWGSVPARAAFTQATANNTFLRSVILQISEAHDLGDKRFPFYDTTKDWMAAPPPTLNVQDKWILQHPIFNSVGVIITTNHLTDGLYLPWEDRRHYVAWSQRTALDFPADYWNRFWDWYENKGGLENVAAYLASYDLDLDGFDPKAPPPKTEAWHAIVAANREPAESDLRGVLADMTDDSFLDGPGGNKLPEAITLDTLRRWCAGVMDGDIEGDEDACKDLWSDLSDRKQRRRTAHRLERAGYSIANNPGGKGSDGLWRFAGKRCAIYVRSDITGRARYRAVRELMKREECRARLAQQREAKKAAAKVQAAGATQ